MFVAEPRKLTLTLLVYLGIALALVGSVKASDLNHEGLLRRDHMNLKRMFKKRSPQTPNFRVGDTPGPVAGAGSDPASLSESSSSASATPSASSISTSASSTASSTSDTLNLTFINDPIAGPSSRTVTATQSQAQAEATESSAPKKSGATSTSGKVLTVIIVVASSIAGIAIIWTIFRKWKLARSSRFDERLQPIDWQPTNPDEGIIPAHRRVTSDTSFQSGSNHHGDNLAGRGVAAGYGATSDHGHGSASDHDFGSAHLAPVGGYADLARGPSPQPQMQQLAHGPSMNGPNYNVGVPLHHQTGYAEAYDYNGGPVRF
ncbi:Kinase protein [Salix suchowensis]|nr:Kinase protein [Salix suchowensis]